MANSNSESVGSDYINDRKDKEKLLPTSVRRMKLPKNFGPGLKKRILWKIVLFFMGMFFFAAAYVQHNDPDPYLWMPVYLLPCLMNFLFIFHLPTVTNLKFWNIFNLTVVIHVCYCFILGLLTLVGYYLHGSVESYIPLFPSTLKEPNMTLEEGKELLGLCLVIAWLAFLYNGNFLKSGKGGIALAAVLTGLPILAWVYVEKIEEQNTANCKN